MNENGNLKKGIIAILAANIINLIFNLFTNFMLPKFLSIDSYAAIKTFQLYTSYIGIFALGYSDGMYLRYGGKELAKIKYEELKSGMFSFRMMMLIESIILILFSVLHGDKIIIGFAFTILSVNMTNYFKNLYQAVGEFSLYGKVLNGITVCTFAVNIFLLFLVRTDDYFLYLVAYAIVDAIIWISLEVKIFQIMRNKPRGLFSAKMLWDDIKSGFLLMVGNFSNILLSSMDRWFVKAMMNSVQFAYYSFAVSMEGFLNVCITPITTTLYNYFCNHRDYDDIVRIRKYVMLFGSVMVAVAFMAKFVIEIFLKKYEEAVDVLFILFAAQMVYIIIKGIYINLYKASKRQKLYFFRLVVVLTVGVLLNYSFIKVYPCKEAFSYGTLISAFIWLTLSILDFKIYKFEIREWLYLSIEVVIFIILGINLNAILGFCIYIIFSLLMMEIFMRKEMKILAGKVLSALQNK